MKCEKGCDEKKGKKELKRSGKRNKNKYVKKDVDATKKWREE